MDKVIVYVDDAEHALEQLAPVLAAGGRTEWLLVACAPRMTHRISKWVSHTARENWRNKWADKLFALTVPPLHARGDLVTTVLARGPLPELTDRLIAEHGPARVVDVRRPKFDQGAQVPSTDKPAGKNGRWGLPGTVASLGLVLVLVGE
jgi:hypothetical protein